MSIDVVFSPYSHSKESQKDQGTRGPNPVRWPSRQTDKQGWTQCQHEDHIVERGRPEGLGEKERSGCESPTWSLSSLWPEAVCLIPGTWAYLGSGCGRRIQMFCACKRQSVLRSPSLPTLPPCPSILTNTGQAQTKRKATAASPCSARLNPSKSLMASVRIVHFTKKNKPSTVVGNLCQFRIFMLVVNVSLWNISLVLLSLFGIFSQQ